MPKSRFFKSNHGWPCLSHFHVFTTFRLSDIGPRASETLCCVCTMMALRKTGLGRCRRLKRPPIPYSRLTQEHFFKNLKIEEPTVGIIAPRHCIYMHISVFWHLRGAISISEIRKPVYSRMEVAMCNAKYLEPGWWIISGLISGRCIRASGQ